MIVPPLQTLLTASAPLVAIVGDRISQLSRFTGDVGTSVIYWIESDEPASIDGSERLARVSVGVVDDDDETADTTLVLAVDAIFAGIEVLTNGVTIKTVVDGDKSYELSVDDGNGNELQMPVHLAEIEIYYKVG